MWIDKKNHYLRRRLGYTLLFCIPLIIAFSLLATEIPTSYRCHVNDCDFTEKILSFGQRALIVTSFLFPVLLIPFISIYVQSRKTIKKSGMRIDENIATLPSGESINLDETTSIVFFPDENRILFARNIEEKNLLEELVSSLETHSRRFTSFILGSIILRNVLPKVSNVALGGAIAQGLLALNKIRKMEVKVPSSGVMNKKELRAILEERLQKEINKKTMTRTFIFKRIASNTK